MTVALVFFLVVPAVLPVHPTRTDYTYCCKDLTSETCRWVIILTYFRGRPIPSKPTHGQQLMVTPTSKHGSIAVVKSCVHTARECTVCSSMDMMSLT